MNNITYMMDGNGALTYHYTDTLTLPMNSPQAYDNYENFSTQCKTVFEALSHGHVDTAINMLFDTEMTLIDTELSWLCTFAYKYNYLEFANVLHQKFPSSLDPKIFTSIETEALASYNLFLLEHIYGLGVQTDVNSIYNSKKGMPLFLARFLLMHKKPIRAFFIHYIISKPYEDVISLFEEPLFADTFDISKQDYFSQLIAEIMRTTGPVQTMAHTNAEPTLLIAHATADLSTIHLSLYDKIIFIIKKFDTDGTSNFFSKNYQQIMKQIRKEEDISSYINMLNDCKIDPHTVLIDILSISHFINILQSSDIIEKVLTLLDDRITLETLNLVLSRTKNPKFVHAFIRRMKEPPSIFIQASTHAQAPTPEALYTILQTLTQESLETFAPDALKSLAVAFLPIIKYTPGVMQTLTPGAQQAFTPEAIQATTPEIQKILIYMIVQLITLETIQ